MILNFNPKPTRNNLLLYEYISIRSTVTYANTYAYAVLLYSFTQNITVK